MKKNRVKSNCGMCQNYDSFRERCSVKQDTIIKYNDTNYSEKCKEEGNFIRYIYTIADPSDLSRVPKDENGEDLIVVTKRGMERAIPANDSVKLIAEPVFGVKRILTYQGQREIIYEIGVELAKYDANREGVELTVLPEEEGAEGITSYIQEYKTKILGEKRPNTPWLSENPVKEWV